MIANITHIYTIGYAFIVVYSVAGMLFGTVADRWNRPRLIALGLTLWAAASIAVVANPAAGKGPGNIELREIEEALELGMERVRTLLENAIPIVIPFAMQRAK